MFKFLIDDTEAGNERKDSQNGSTVAAADAVTIKLNVATEIHPSELHSNIILQIPYSTLADNILAKSDGSKYISVQELLRSSFTRSDENIKEILDSSSDLISGVYEGGFKIWECTFDLINYLRKHSEEFAGTRMLRILDLGCGSGLLGLFALTFEHAVVHFQDYNPEVINFLTIPNVFLNYGEEGCLRSKFFSGDWLTFDELLSKSRKSRMSESDTKYDYIFSSETLYNLENFDKLYRVVLNQLKPSGSLFLASKTCYFGVGGGTTAFKALVERDGRMEYEVVNIFREGVQREVLRLKFRSWLCMI